MTAAALAPGFVDPVHDAQRTFRLVLDAMSHPGSIVEVASAVTAPGLAPAAAAVALALCDLETPIWLDAETSAAAAWLRFHCGTPIVGAVGEARFAFVRHIESMPPLDAFALGTDEYPDRSATLVIEVAALCPGDGIVFAGPGIKDTARLRVDGVGREFWHERASLAELFPRGVDLVLTCGRQLAALPRTTTVKE